MGELIRRIEMGSHASAFAFTNDLAYAFWGHCGCNWFAVVDCRSEDWQSAPVFEGHERPVTCLAVPGHARVVVSGSADRSLRLWEVENRNEILRLDGHSTAVTCVDITADGRRIISGDRAGGVHLWQVDPFQHVVLTGHIERLTSVVFSPDGSKALSAGWDKTVRVWDVKSAEEICCFARHAHEIECATFSGDGGHIISAGHQSLSGRGEDDQLVITNVITNVMSNDMVRLWNSSSGEELCTFRAEINPVVALVFSPDSSSVLLGGGSGTFDSSATLEDRYKRHAVLLCHLPVFLGGVTAADISRPKEQSYFLPENLLVGQEPWHPDPVYNLVAAIAERECKRICRKVIRHLQSLKEGYIQSGDDTPLENVWDEVCVQVRGQESFLWEDAYLETIRGILLGFVQGLDIATKQAIWLQTQAGEEWQDDEEDGAIPYWDEDVVEYILDSYVLSAADAYTNFRIKKYLNE